MTNRYGGDFLQIESVLPLAAALLAIIFSPLFPASADQATELKPDVTIQRELSGGETHAYQVRLEPGQFLYVTIEQEGIDVAGVLIGPDGKQICASDSTNGDWGPEPVVAIATLPGEYRLEVRSGDTNAPPGRYEVRIVALREATAEDREHVSADRAFEEAEKQFELDTAASRAVAIEDFTQALRFYRSSGDRYRQAITLYTTGATYVHSNDFRRGLENFLQAFPIFEALGDARMQSATLSFVGGANDVLGNLQEALKNYEQALALLRNAKDPSTQGDLLNNIGKIYGDLGNWEKSEEYYDQALGVFRALKDERREAITTHNLGVTYGLVGEPEKGLEYLERALPLSRAVGDKSEEAETLSAIGAAKVQLGQPQQAIADYEQALVLRRAVEDHWGEGTTLKELGVAQVALNQPGRAVEYFQQALAAFRVVGDRRDEGVTFYGLGEAYARLGEPRKEAESENQALAIFEALGDRDDAGRALADLARAERDLGEVGEARKHIESALALVEKVRASAGSEQERASYFATQQSAYEFYIDLLMRFHRQDPSAGYDALALEASERARARSLLEMLNEARVDFRQGVDASLLARERKIAELLSAKDERSLTLTGSNAKEAAAALKKEISDLETEYQQVELAIRKSSPRYAAISQPEVLTVSQIQQRVLDPDTELLEYALGDEHSYLWVVTNSSLKSYQLPPREQIDQVARKVYELVTARATYVRGELPDQRKARIATADAQLGEAASHLSEMVLGPAAGELAGHRLAIVADGSLQQVPFAMLPAPGQTQPLMIAHEIVYLPSASTVAVLREEVAGRKPAPKMVAVLADPVFDPDDERVKSRVETVAVTKRTRPAAAAGDTRLLQHLLEDTGQSGLESGRLVAPRLPYTRQEAESILAVAPLSASMEALDFRASLATATSPELGQYRYVHFATHGYLDTERPGLSAIVLSMVDEHGNPEDGFLRANEIYNLKIPAELVVLSACQTGLGKEIRGEGLVGLTRGFMYAGAPRVVVSLWSVNDRATADLMADFYRKMLKQGKRPAAALREAQMEMWKQRRWQAPFYWAAFIQQGEWK